MKLCILGKDDFGASIDTLSGRKLQGKIIQIERAAATAQLANDCNIVFVGKSERERLPAIFAALASKPVLTVSDLEEFAARGGMIGFATADNKITFQINPDASRRAGLDIGAQLLQFATLVTEQHKEGKQ